MVGQQPKSSFDGSVDYIARIDPLRMGSDPLAADARRVKQILNEAIEALGFLVQSAHQGA